MKKNFNPKPLQPRNNLEVMRQPSKAFSVDFQKMLTKRSKDKWTDESLENSFQADILEEQPNSMMKSEKVMNMDDRDKAGDPDSNPEIDDSESDVSVKPPPPK